MCADLRADLSTWTHGGRHRRGGAGAKQFAPEGEVCRRTLGYYGSGSRMGRKPCLQFEPQPLKIGERMHPRPGKSRRGATPRSLRWALTRDVDSADPWFKALEACQAEFVVAHRMLSMQGYKWPVDPLYDWSRRAEYPFVARTLAGLAPSRILDAGAGVTFLPLFLSRLGHCVDCLDSDGGYPARMGAVLGQLGETHRVRYFEGDLAGSFELSGSPYDVVLSVSVIEHLDPQVRERAVQGLCRLLRPGGLLILTLDVSLSDRGGGLSDHEVGRLGDLLGQLAATELSPVGRPPSLALTTGSPAYLRAPIRFAKRVLRGRFRRLYHALRRDPLPTFPPLGCLLAAIKTPENISGVAWST